MLAIGTSCTIDDDDCCCFIGLLASAGTVEEVAEEPAPERGTRLAGGGRESGDMEYLAGMWKVGRSGVLLSAAGAVSGLVLG